MAAFSHLKVGDEALINDSTRWSAYAQRVDKGRVLRITATGQIVVNIVGATGEYTRRFQSSGAEIGGYGWLLTPERYAASLRRLHVRDGKRAVRDATERLTGKIASQTKAETLAALRELLALAEAQLVEEDA